MPHDGVAKRGSASGSARAPWSRARATRPEGGTSGYSSATRGYQKLEGAARAFGFDFRGKIVLDIGSSTGGFTKYAINHGAKYVIAVEKGTNQMEKPLRFDPRIDLHEKTDIFTFRLPSSTPSPAQAQTLATNSQEDSLRPTTPDVILADVSFLSLTKILKYAKMNLSRSNTDYLVMLKPQFEATPNQLTRGVVKNESTRRGIIKQFECWLRQNGFLVIQKHDNDLTGKTGNRERFYYLCQEKTRGSALSAPARKYTSITAKQSR